MGTYGVGIFEQGENRDIAPLWKFSHLATSSPRDFCTIIVFDRCKKPILIQVIEALFTLLEKILTI